MFKKIEILNSNKHGGLKFNIPGNYDFARNQTVAPLSFREMDAAARFYPIVFPREGDLYPQALLSVFQKNNLFIDDQGGWTVSYVPAHIRRYPFILGKKDQEGRYTLGIDPDAPHFNYEQGEPLFTGEGEITEPVTRAVNFLKQYQQEMDATLRLLAPLQEKELLVDKEFNIEHGGSNYKVHGFKAVDEDELTRLDNDTLGEWVKNGLMGLIYAHLHSLRNIQELVKAAGLHKSE